MSLRLPLVLSSDDLPLPELLAARLDGEVFSIDRCFAPLDEFDQPRMRAACLARGLNARLIAERRTAAWIWGAREHPPHPHEFCVSLSARVAHRISGRMLVREVMIDPEDISEVEGVQVTTPLRTVSDIVRFSDDFGAQEVAEVIALMRIGDLDLERCLDQLDRRRNLPNKRLAASRLRRCAALTPA